MNKNNIMLDWVIQIDTHAPCFVNEERAGGIVYNIAFAELFSTENEARENMNAFMRNNPGMKCRIKSIEQCSRAQ